MSSHALQVRFLQLAPDETLIALAAAHYKQMRLGLVGPNECAVRLERDQGQDSLVHAVVRIHERGRARAEGCASHRDAEIALKVALLHVRARLGAVAAPAPIDALWCDRPSPENTQRLVKRYATG